MQTLHTNHTQSNVREDQAHGRQEKDPGERAKKDLREGEDTIDRVSSWGKGWQMERDWMKTEFPSIFF